MIFKGSFMGTLLDRRVLAWAPIVAAWASGSCKYLNIELSRRLSRDAVLPNLGRRGVTKPMDYDPFRDFRMQDPQHYGPFSPLPLET